MDMTHSVNGMVTVHLIGADLPATLKAAAGMGIMLEEIVPIDELRLTLCVHRQDVRLLARLAEKRGDRMEIKGRSGVFYRLRALCRRPILTLGLIAFVLLSLWVPTKILWIEVEGNETISARAIAQTAAAYGLNFGARRSEVRSERLKNALLAAMPQLQWAGVNTYGCRAVITVRERNAEVPSSPQASVSSIVALRDGIVREMTVLKGNALCAPGQAVKKGEVLISAYTDCGLCIRATRATGEIYAETQRRLTAIMPTQYSLRTQNTATSEKFFLIIGKKRINFFKGSGISGPSCAKIYERYDLTLPGGFQLPIALCRERCYDYDTQAATVSQGDRLLHEFAAAYLPTLMTAGKITSENERLLRADGYVTLSGVYHCYEMIGISRPEEQLHE